MNTIAAQLDIITCRLSRLIRIVNQISHDLKDDPNCRLKPCLKCGANETRGNFCATCNNPPVS